MFHLGGPAYPGDILSQELVPSLFKPAVRPLTAPASGLYLAEVVDVIARLNCYVIRPLGLPNMPAVLASDSPYQMLGSRDLSCLLPRTFVLALVKPEQPWAVILGALPVPNGSPMSGWADSLVGGSRVGLYIDEVHKFIATDSAAHGMYDFSGGRPVDHLPGDWGALNELGIGLFVGRLMAFLRAADDCKLEFHYTDSLARLVARNFERMTSSTEEQDYDDEGECSVLDGVAAYAWEGLGSLDRTQAPFDLDPERDVTTAKMQTEPLEDQQSGFFRLWQARGYLGDLRRSFVSIPAELSGFNRLKLSSETTPRRIGLYEDWVGYDGRMVVRSAKGLLFEKSCLIRIPEQRQTLDSPEGDREFEDGPGGADDHLLEPEIPEELTDTQSLAFNIRAYTYSKLMGDGFNRHTKDWYVPKFSETKGPGSFSEESWVPTPAGGLQMDLPPQVEQKIDHRAKSKFYKSRAFCEITDDGSIVLGDGYGSSIILSRGNIELSCMGDITLRHGRNLVAWSGGDISLRAHDSIDLSAGNGDLRLKAENLMSILGGNSGSGGVLIENRATSDLEIEDKDTADATTVSTGGIALKSAGAIQMWSDGLFVQTNDLALSAANAFELKARDMGVYLTGKAVQAIGPAGQDWTQDNTTVVEQTGNSWTVACSSVNLAAASLTMANSRTGRDAGSMSVALKGNLSVNGVIQNPSAKVLKLSAEAMNSAFTRLTSTVSDTLSESIDGANTFDGRYIEPATGLGNPEYYAKIGFSFRDSEDYRVLTAAAQTSTIFETSWQHMLHEAGIAGSTWDEPEVPSYIDRANNDEGHPTMAYPGYDAWNGQPVNGQEVQFVRVTDRNYTWTSEGYRIRDDVTAVSPELDGGPFVDRYLLGGG